MTANPVTGRGKHFMNNIRHYNNTLSMASSGISTKFAHPTEGITQLAIKGGFHHSIGPLLPSEGHAPKFAQLYIMDNGDSQLQARMAAGGGCASGLDPAMLRELQDMLIGSNTYVQHYCQMKDIPLADLAQYEIIFKTDGTVDKRRYNAPGGGDVAGIMPGTGHDPDVCGRHIRVRARDVGNSTGRYMSAISDLHAAYDPLHFVLLHPRGEPGWHTSIRKAATGGGTATGEGGAAGTGDGEDNGRNITALQYAAFFMHDRECDHCLITHGGKIFQEWTVDQYCKVETQRLRYLRLNQTHIRADVYQGVIDSLQAGETTAAMQGRLTILPSSFIGGPR